MVISSINKKLNSISPVHFADPWVTHNWLEISYNYSGSGLDRHIMKIFEYIMLKFRVEFKRIPIFVEEFTILLS